jgi:hypothetical protein
MSVIKTECECGVKITIKTGNDSKSDFRSDGRQFTYTDDPNRHNDSEYCIFRCEGCEEVIDKSCKQAA